MFVLISLLFLASVHAQTNQIYPDGLSTHPKWLKLLHYKKTWSGWKSQADGEAFFLHPRGKYNPRLELDKTIEIFSSETKPSDNHAICKFPLRYKWLNQSLGFPWQADHSGCSRYQEFFHKLAAKRATMVFSSYYLNNPSSAFGHTLLRLSRYEDSSETEILDYGINYAAESRSDDPLTYALKGLMGGYQGQFRAIPYYYKIREYSNGEFRDLWSYDLNLSKLQVLELVDHLWELGHTHFDYFYFLENCSYHLLGVLDVVMPEKNLTENFTWFTIPADTIRLLRKEGLIGEGKRRESTYSELKRLSSGVDQVDLRDAKKIALNPTQTNELVADKSQKSAAAVLDISLAAFDFYHSRKILSDDKATQQAKRPILLARAINSIITQDSLPTDSKRDSPSLSHAPLRLGLSQGYQHRLGQQTRFEFRTAFHDLLDPPDGSLKDGELEMVRLSLIYGQQNYQQRKLKLDRFSLLSFKNFPGQDFWASPISWKFDVGAKQVDEILCRDCPGGYLNASVGNTLQLAQGKFLVALLINTEIMIHSAFQENYRLGLGPKVYSRIRLAEQLVTGLEISYHLNSYSAANIFQDQAWVTYWETRYHINDRFSLALRASHRSVFERESSAGELGLQYFY